MAEDDLGVLVWTWSWRKLLIKSAGRLSEALQTSPESQDFFQGWKQTELWGEG